jgi:hypothetical protein
MQLDIFNDSRDTQLRNDVAGALSRHDSAAASAACTRLSQEFPADGLLAPALRLIRAIEQRAGPAFTSHEEAEHTQCALVAEIEPAAHRVLGRSGAAAWLAAEWAALAQRAARLAFDPRHSGNHAAALWLRAGNWDQASAATGRIESWRRIPVPLCWMAQARYHQLDLDGSWELLAELAWLSPTLLDEVMRAIADPLLHKLRQRFESVFDGGIDDLAWFPAWLLTEKPSLAPRLATAQRGTFTPPEQAMRLLLELLGLERRGSQHDIVRRRKALRDTHPALYACYMAAR